MRKGMARGCRDSWRMGCGQDFRRARAQVGRVPRSSFYREVFAAPKTLTPQGEG